MVDIHPWTAYDYYVTLPAMANAMAIWRQNVEVSLAQSLAGLEEQFPAVIATRVVDERAPVEALLDAAGQADLVVLGTRSRSGMPRWALGSVARTVMIEASCPVLVVPHDQRVRQYDDVVTQPAA